MKTDIERNKEKTREKAKQSSAASLFVFHFARISIFFFFSFFFETRYCCGRSLESFFFPSPSSIRFPVLVYLILSCHCDNFYYYYIFFSFPFLLSWIRAINIFTMLMCPFHTPHAHTHIHRLFFCVYLSMRHK